MENTKLPDDALRGVSAGAAKPKYISAFFCEACGKTIRLSGVYLEERAKKEHNAKFHPGLKK
ncbi:MAG: hypothetical protein K6F56_02340 [Oscillospiraceae bacterium]|nr:hypothetical protein [Oscillospiraceae bacterium]